MLSGAWPALNLISLFNPETIIFGGGVFGPAIRFLGEIAAEALVAQLVSARRVRFEVSALGGDAGLYGAAYLAFKQVRGKSLQPPTQSFNKRRKGRAQ